MKYLVIESSPISDNIIAYFNTQKDAENSIDKMRNCNCDYYISKIVA